MTIVKNKKAAIKRICILQNRISGYQTKVSEAAEKDHQKIANLGLGYGMRAYHRGMKLKLDSDQKWLDKIKAAEEEISYLKEHFYI